MTLGGEVTAFLNMYKGIATPLKIFHAVELFIVVPGLSGLLLLVKQDISCMHICSKVGIKTIFSC